MVKKIAFLLLIGFQAFSQVSLEANYNLNIESAGLRYHGLNNLLLGEAVDDAKLSTYIDPSRGHLRTQYETGWRVGLNGLSTNSGFDLGLGINFYNYSEVGADVSVYRLLVLGNQNQTTASLDNLEYLNLNWTSLSANARWKFSSSEFMLRTHLAWLNQYAKLDNKTGELNNPNNGQDIYLSYDYELENSTSNSKGLGLLFDFQYVLNLDDCNFLTVDLDHVGAFYQSASNVKAMAGDTSYQGVDLFDLVNGSNENGSLEQFFLEGTEENILILSPIKTSIAWRRLIERPWIEEVMIKAENPNLLGGFWHLNASSKHFIGESLNLNPLIGIGEANSFRAGLALGYRFNQHEINLGSHHLTGPIFGAFNSGINITASYKYTL